MCGVEGVRRLLKFGATSGASLHDLHDLFVLAPDLGWVSSLTDGHATMLRSAVSSGRQVVHQSRRIFVGHEVSSAAAAAKQSSQSATSQLCVGSSVLG